MVRKLSELSGKPEEGTFFTTPMGVLFMVLTNTIHDFTFREFTFKVKFVGRLIDGERLGLNFIHQTSTGWDLQHGPIPTHYTEFGEMLQEKEQQWIKMLQDHPNSAQEEVQGSGGAAVAAPVAEAGPAVPASLKNTVVQSTIPLRELRRGNQVVLPGGRAMVISPQLNLDRGVEGVLSVQLKENNKLIPRLLCWVYPNAAQILKGKDIPDHVLNHWERYRNKPNVLQTLIATRDELLAVGASAGPAPPPVAETAVQAASGEAGNPIVIDD